MQSLSRTYSLRRFTSSRDPDFPAAINIYATSLSPQVLTDSNEITYWLDRTYHEFKDEFLVFGFYADDKVIGFAEAALFRADRLLVFDYLVLHKGYRSHGEYFEFARILQEWISEAHLEFNYVVAEVSYEQSGHEPTRHSIQLVELFKQLGFGVAHCEYFQPLLGLDNAESDVRAHLLVAGHEKLNQLKRQTLAQIVKTIYFKHYARWYSCVLKKDADIYLQVLEAKYQEFEEKLKSDNEIIIDGIDFFQPSIQVPRPPRAAKRIAILQPLIVIGAFGLFCAVLLIVQWFVQLPLEVITLLVGASLILFSMIFAIFTRDGQKVFKIFLEALPKIVGTHKSHD